ncbi:MAG: universal stress protein [Dehalococcoidia bacterium]
MFERILVPLDGSELAERALPYAGAIAKRLGSEVVLLTVSGPGDCVERPLRAYLEKRADELLSPRAKASSLVLEGDAAEEILNLAETNYVDLIVISTHGCSGSSRWPVGSIAGKVLLRSHTPTLLVKPGAPETALDEIELRRILVALDGSHFAESIIPCVEGLAVGMSSEVSLLRVVEPVRLPRLDAYGHWDDLEKYEKDLSTEAEKEAERYLSGQGLALRQKGVSVTSSVVSGPPAEVLLQYAEDHDVSLIALSTHGYSGITRWAYGSVASRIVEGSSRPVLLVRPEASPGD